MQRKADRIIGEPPYEEELPELPDDAQAELAITRLSTGGLAVLGGPEELKVRLDTETQALNIIDDFIRHNLVAGIDYGIADDRSAKKTLLLPGAEKVRRAFNCHTEWSIDKDVHDMLGSPKDVVCLVCRIIDNRTGKIVGEGRGAEKVGSKGRDYNKTIKEAEKCALVDAVKGTFAMSGMFTQDDGGASSATSLSDAKAQFLADVQFARANIPSELTDLQWLMKVAQAVLHKKGPQTIGELDYLRKTILTEKQYNMATGEKNDVT